MRVPKDILFRLLFLTAVIFCLGLEVYSYYNPPMCNTELSSEQNCEDNNVLSHFDSFEDDHINQPYEYSYFVEQLIVIPISKESFVLKEFSYSNWQPPKYSCQSIPILVNKIIIRMS